MKIRERLALILKAAVEPLGFGRGWPVIIRETFPGAFQAHAPTIDGPREVASYSPVYAAISKISGDTAKCRPRLMEEMADGTCAEVKGPSPIKRVLRRPNGMQNYLQFLRMWVVSLLTWGNTYVLLERDSSYRVIAMYILNPQRVKSCVTDTGAVWYDLSPDNMSAGIVNENVRVPAAEIIHDRVMCLWHPLCGIPPLYAAAVAATMGSRILQNSTAFFENMSLPGGVLTHPEKLDDESIQDLKTRWDQNYGKGNSGKVAVLANGLKFEPSQVVAAQDAQLLEQLDWTVNDVARAFGIPAYKIGGELPANTSVDALNQSYYSETLQIIFESIELCLGDALVSDENRSIELDLTALLRLDFAAQVKAHTELVKGIEKVNEARRAFNLPPVKGGDTVYMQEQNYSLEALAKRDARADPFAKGSTKPPPEPAANDDDMDVDEAKALLADIAKGVFA